MHCLAKLRSVDICYAQLASGAHDRQNHKTEEFVAGYLYIRETVSLEVRKVTFVSITVSKLGARYCTSSCEQDLAGCAVGSQWKLFCHLNEPFLVQCNFVLLFNGP